MRFSLASTVGAVLGATLLTTHLVSPAGSAPVQTTPPVSEASDAAVKAGVANVEKEMPGLAEVNAELARLQGRLDVPVAPPPAGRNPFDFGNRPERRNIVAVPIVPTPLFDAAPFAVAPTLVAILSDTIDGRVVRTAVFSVNDDVAFMANGDDVTGFQVGAIESDVVTLIERSSGRTLTLSLN